MARAGNEARSAPERAFHLKSGAVKAKLTLLVACAFLMSACAREAAPPEPLAPNPGAMSAEALAQTVSQSIQFQTISQAGNPRASWEAFEAQRAWMAETFARTFTDMSVEDLGSGTLWLTLPGSNPNLEPIVLIAHQDVVPVESGTETDWTYAPFDGVIADGFVWGRGALDMKGHLVAVLAAAATAAAARLSSESASDSTSAVKSESSYTPSS